METIRWKRAEEEPSREADVSSLDDACSLLEGDPLAYLPFFRYVMLEYSVPLKRELFHQEEMSEGWEDGKFAEAMFRACRDKLHLFPSLNAKQFMSQGFSERKLMLLLDVVSACRTRNTELQRQMRIESKRITAAEVRHLHENNRSKVEAKTRKDHEGIRYESERKKGLQMEESLLVRMAKQVSELTSSLEKLSANLSETEQRMESIESAHKQDQQSIQIRVEKLEERMDNAQPPSPTLVVREDGRVDDETRATCPDSTSRTIEFDASEVLPTGAPLFSPCDVKMLSSQGSTRELVEAVRNSCSSARSLLASLH